MEDRGSTSLWPSSILSLPSSFYLCALCVLGGLSFGSHQIACPEPFRYPGEDAEYELDTDLNQTLQYRNYLAHKFFVEHSEDFLTESGRAKMIQELQEIVSFVRRVDREVDEVWVAAWERLGIDWDRLLGLVDRLRERASATEIDG